jgi:hypothetical protein
MAPVYKFSNAGGMTSKQRYTSMLAGNPVFVPNSFDSIETAIVGAGGQSTVTFSTIPQTYKHLQLRIIARSNSGSPTSLSFTFNGDTNNANYFSRHLLFGDGTTAAAINNPTLTGITGGSVSPSTTSLVAPNIIDLTDYSSTVKNKTLRILGGYDATGSGAIGLGSGLWLNTNAITSITITAFGGPVFTQHSHFALYGIKG